MSDLDVKGLFSSMLQTPVDNLTLDRERMLGTAHRAMRRRRGVRLGIASAVALSAIGTGTATASALRSTDVPVARQLPVPLLAGQLPKLPNALPAPRLPKPALPKPDLPVPSLGSPRLPTLPSAPVELRVGPKLERAKKMLAELTDLLRAGSLPLPAGLPGVGDLPVSDPQVSSAQAFRYADGAIRYHAVSAGAVSGFGGTVTVDVVSKKQTAPTGDLCAARLVQRESGCEVVASGDGQRVRLGWRTAGGVQTYYATAFYPAGTTTVELSPTGLDRVALPTPALAALAALPAFRP